MPVASEGRLTGREVPATRVVACCGGMVNVAGMERMTFEVLRVLRERGASVHCILNSWKNEQIRELAESIGASWTTGYYWVRFDRHTWNPIRWLALIWDVVCTSAGLLRDVARFRATHVLIPEYVTVLRNAPALCLLRCCGVTVLLRLANAPERGRFYERIWRWIIPPLVTRIVANSEFAKRRCVESGVPTRKLRLVKNAVSRRPGAVGAQEIRWVELARSRRTLLCVGQIAPFKGTHLAVEATIALLEQDEDLQLLIVGAAPDWPQELLDYYERLIDRVHRAGVSDKVVFTGTLALVLPLMEASFLLLAPILQEETFGNVALEARSVGLPVVAFARGGLPELVEHERTGYLCGTLDRDGLMTGIRYFIDHPEAWDSAVEVSRRSLAEPGCTYRAESFSASWASLLGMAPR